MTEESVATPPPTAPERRPRGFHVPTWVATLVVGLIVFGIAFAVGRAIDNHGDGRGRFGDGGFGHHGGGRGIGFIVFLLLVALVVAAVVLVVRRFVSRPRAAGSAEHLLAERFARGEIDEVEYRHRRDALRS
jgi:putative membrane protein